MSLERAISSLCVDMQQAGAMAETALLDGDMGALVDALAAVVLDANNMADILGLPLENNIILLRTQYEKTHLR